MGFYVLKFPYRKALLPLAGVLACVHPDILSYLATLVALGTACCFLWAGSRPPLLLAAVGLTLIRITLNTLDGVIAIRRGDSRWLHGEIVNALPDRYSDALYVAGIAFSTYCHAAWGAAALVSMFLVSYTGMLGKALGGQWQHHGPLGKVERLILVMVFSVLQFFALVYHWPAVRVLSFSLTPAEICMALYVVLGQITVYNRVRGMTRQIKRLEWPRRNPLNSADARVMVVFDSETGNTEKVAQAVAEALRADLSRVDRAGDPQQYDLVALGSPSIGGRPTRAMQRYVKAHAGLGNYAAFFTWGAPVWGPISVRKGLAWIRRTIGREPLATFHCKGRHAILGTYRRRPNDDDLLSAFLFGMRLAKLLGRQLWTPTELAARSCG